MKNSELNRHIGNISITIIEPTAAGNIGAIARAMANFGFQHLTLVNPKPFDMEMAKSFACNGAHILSSVKTVQTFEEAVCGASAVIGMTRRARKSEATIPVEKTARTILNSTASGTAIIVFGRERSGLSKEEKSKCTVLSHIDSVEGAAGSLNISHAALLIMHEIFRAAHDVTIEPADTVPLFKAFDQFCSIQSDYEKDGTIQKIFKSSIIRAALNRDEVNKLTKFFGRLSARTKE